MMYQILFSGKNKNNITKLSSAKLTKRVVKVKGLWIIHILLFGHLYGGQGVLLLFRVLLKLGIQIVYKFMFCNCKCLYLDWSNTLLQIFCLISPRKLMLWYSLEAPAVLMSTQNKIFEGWAQDYCNSNMFLKPLFRGNLDPFVNNANLGVIAHTSNGT